MGQLLDKVANDLLALARGDVLTIPDTDWIKVQEEREREDKAAITLRGFVANHRKLKLIELTLRRAPTADAWIATIEK